MKRKLLTVLLISWALVFGPFLPSLSAQWLVVLAGSTPIASNSPWITAQAIGTARNNATLEVGIAFTVGGSNLTVKELGRWVLSGNSSTHVLNLCSGTVGGTRTVLGTVTVNTSGAGAGAYLYGTLSSSVTLTASTTYFLFSAETNGGDQWSDDVGTTITTNTSVASPRASHSAAYWDGASITIATDGPAHLYGPVNFKY